MKQVFLLVSICFWAFPITAQFQGNVYQQSTDAQVYHYGNLLAAAFCGGINSVQISQPDLNHDGKNDLVLFDQNNNVLKTFITNGSGTNLQYNYQPQYEKNFPVALTYLNYLILKDYNCDNIPDLFHNGFLGCDVYRGYYQNNELKFSFYRTLYAKRVTQNDSINVYVQNNDIPSIEDIDGDGDLDITAFDVQGVFPVLHRNMQVEWGLPCDSIKMIVADKCWGKFFQGFNRSVIFNTFCINNFTAQKKERHTGNAILQIDMDNDGDFDLLGGNISYNDVQLVFNDGNDVMFAEDTLYQSNGHMLHLNSWPAPFYTDIDQDGDRDLIFTSHIDDGGSANYFCTPWYKNTGSATTTNFVYQHDTLLTSQMIDLGAYSYPTLFDFDKDGKKDLFVGSEGVLNQQTGLHETALFYYRNTSIGSQISFELVSNNFLQLKSKNYAGIFPTFGDVNGDGIDDLVIGHASGKISLYNNTASSNAVMPVFNFFTDSLLPATPYNYSFPLIWDVNKDGKKDIVIGNETGSLTLFTDTSVTSSPAFSWQTNQLGAVNAGKYYTTFGYAAPTLARVDNLDSIFLVVGTADGQIERYDSIFNYTGKFRRIDSAYSHISTANRAVPAIADLNGDGKYDMIVGNRMGGLVLYKQVMQVVGNQWVQLNPIDIEVYPNPAQDYIRVQINSQDAGQQPWQCKLTDITGHVLQSGHTINGIAQFSLQHMPSGIYLMTCQHETQVVTKKIIHY